MNQKQKKNKSRIMIIFLFTLVMATIMGGWYLLQGANNYQPLTWSPEKQQKTDYMEKVLNRNWRPLGLLENPELKKYLGQPDIFWAIRSSERHILN
ncbi:MAG: hypothetical protein B5M54_01110 [Candidatus Aminicenantes bacterium 4484_214]|nr:MAG: hypothetical protein B5M54_01110 [Candidatus Aminicenantes bacterium 4484_214]RLE08876.1 MAG: hypothetical protein DRJ06_03900 [Candidatus Aminicenantes bacterium]